MKQFIAILTCLILVLASTTSPAAANEAPACEGCGCATMTCCPSDSTPADPMSNVPERVLTQKIVAVQNAFAGCENTLIEQPLQSPIAHRAITAPSVPLFIRNCQFLI